jgi:hypothetical protein
MLAIPALGLSASQQPPSPGRMKVLIKSAWGSADPTQAAFAFHHANARARGVLESDLAGKHATFANPAIFVGLVEWADKVLTE